jgi:restriction system protein
MADVTIYRTGELLRKLFAILIEHPEGMRAKDAITLLREQVELTQYEKGKYSSGGERFERIIRFATIDCVKAGWMVKDKGIWTVTDEGKMALARYKEPDIFYREAQRLYRAWNRSRKVASSAGRDDQEIKEKSVTITFEEAEEQAWNEIENYLRTMPPYDLQKLVAALLKAMGYHVSWVSPPGKDGGIDILAWNDPLGTRPPRIKVQVKREQASTNVGTLRSFMALLGDNDVGLFVSTGGFTRDAANEARTQQHRQVTLVDLQRLFELWVEHLEKLDEEARDLLPLKPIYYLAPET